jgi:hypothetical protein
MTSIGAQRSPEAGLTPTIRDDFGGELRHPHWNRLAIGSSWVEENHGAQMIVAGAPAGSLSVAQYDDYINRTRANYAWRAPVTLRTRLRASHPSGDLLGTAGIGFWNNMAPLWNTRMEVYPNWIWFYYASPQSNIALTSGPTSGWKASIVHGGKGGSLAMTLSDQLLKLPWLGKALAGMRMPAQEAALDDVDFTQWRELCIEWQPDVIRFQVDGRTVLEAAVRAAMPLGFVTWLDNNYAAVDTSGKFNVGNLAVPQRQTLELQYLEISSSIQ